MKISVIAANGRSGREFVSAALANGHSVKAGVYGTHRFTEDQNLTVVTCDATDLSQLETLIEGTDAVASFIGHVKKSPPNVQTDAIKNAIAACKKLGVRRIVSQTGTGVRFPGDKITLMDRLLNISISVIDPKRVKDGLQHAEVLKQSGLDWTIIRLLKLSNSEAGPFSLLPNGPTKVFIPRKEAALAALQVLEDGSFIGQAPIIGRKEKE